MIFGEYSRVKWAFRRTRNVVLASFTGKITKDGLMAPLHIRIFTKNNAIFNVYCSKNILKKYCKNISTLLF